MSRKRQAYVGAPSGPLPTTTDGRSYLLKYREGDRLRRRVESYVYSRALDGTEPVSVSEVAMLLRNSNRRDAMGRRGDVAPEELERAERILSDIAGSNRTLRPFIDLDREEVAS